MRFSLVLALICIAAPAHAGPVITGITALVGAISTFAASSALAGFAVNLVGSVLLSAAAAALRGKQAYETIKQGLRVPTTLPAYRFWYGETLCIPSPLQCGVDNSRIYGCVLLNSRPSQEVTTIYLDNRPIVLSGDLYDMAVGAEATNGNFADQVVKFWVGLGDQTEPPPQLVSEMPALFSDTDIWTGCTVLWYKIALGSNKRAAKMWKNRPPEISVLGKWSKVWDPRDVAQDPDDESTWEWSDNQALCLLDFYRSNPIKSWPVAAVHMASFTAAADLADEAVALLAGGTEPRYRVGGVIEFNGPELEDLAQPLHEAGASRPTWIGGQMGIVPGCALDSSMTLTNVLDVEGMEYTRYAPASEMITTVRTTYTAAGRTYEPAELEPYEIPGAQTADGGLEKVGEQKLGLVESATQAMRLQKIYGLSARMQRQISGVLPPAAFDLVAGSVVTVDFPSPFTGRNGSYQIESIHPTVSLLGEDGQVALRCPASMREYSSDIYAWSSSEEQTIANPTFNPDPVEIDEPGAITVLSGVGVALDTGTAIIPRVRFSFDPSTTEAVDGYEWQYQIVSGDWTAGGTIDADVRDGSSDVFGFLASAAAGTSYVIRARARVGVGASDWVTSSSVAATIGVARYEADFENGVYAIAGVTAALANVLGLTRASTATYVSAAGIVTTAAVNEARLDYATGVRALLIEPAATNLHLYSEQADNAALSKVRATVAVNAAVAPDGATTADKLVEDTTAAASHYAAVAGNFTSGTKISFSRYVKAAGRSKFFLQYRSTAFGGVTQMAAFDLVAKTATVVSGSPVPLITELPGGSGWFRVSISATPSSTAASFADLLLADAAGSAIYTGDGTSGLYVWGAQIEDGDVSSYIQTTSASVTRSADVPTMQGITATLDLLATYGDGTTAAISDAPVIPGYWPTLTQTRLRELIGTL